MADTDSSSPIIRYNLVLNQLEYFNGADWYSASTGGSGSIPNVVQSVYTLFATSTSSTAAPTAHTVTITPSKTTSTIKVSLVTNILSTGPGYGIVSVLNSVTAAFLNIYLVDGTGNPCGNMATGITIDAPNTTSPITYTVYLANNDNSTTVYCGNPSGPSAAVLIAEEIFS
jgi:hypothetical protein